MKKIDTKAINIVTNEQIDWEYHQNQKPCALFYYLHLPLHSPNEGRGFEIQLKWRNYSWRQIFFSCCLFLYLHLFYLQLISFTIHISNKWNNSRAYQNLLTHLYPLSYRINFLTYCTLTFLMREFYEPWISRRRKMRHNIAQCAINVYTVKNIKCHFLIYVNIGEANHEFRIYFKSRTGRPIPMDS